MRAVRSICPPWAVMLGLVVWLGVVQSAYAQQRDTDDAIDPALLEQLEQLDELTAQVEDLAAEFVQRRHTPLLKNPITSSGTLLALPGRSRWDTAEPFSSVMVIATDRLEVFYPEENVVEVYPLEARLGELAASPLTRLSGWLEHFTLRAAAAEELSQAMRDDAGVDDDDRPCVLLHLTPRDDDLAEVIPSLVVVIDVQTGLSRAMAWSGQEGERTEVVFRDVRTDTGIDAEDVALDVPDDARVVYPLGPISPIDPDDERPR